MTDSEKELHDSYLTLKDMAVDEKLKQHWARIVEGMALAKGVTKERIEEIRKMVFEILNQ